MDANGNLDWLLELSDSIITYRARYRAQPEWLPVLDLLLLDESNPRSILFQLDGILNSLKKNSTHLWSLRRKTTGTAERRIARTGTGYRLILR